MTEQTARQPHYWQAHGLAELALSHFRGAAEQGQPAQQRSAFYRLARYHGRTLRVLNSGLHQQDEALAQVALHNLQVLHRAMVDMHRMAPHIVPLPLALSTYSRSEFVRDLVMRVLAETPPALDLTTIHARTTELDLLGKVPVEDVTDHLQGLIHAQHIEQDDEGFVRTAHVYTELDKDEAGLRALVGRTFYDKFAKRGYDSLIAIEEQAPAFRGHFPELTGFDDPVTVEHFLETVYVLLETSTRANAGLRHRDLLHSTYPRPYQRAAYSAFRHGDFNSLIVDAPTGSGKTLIGMLCMQDWLRSFELGQSILIMVPTANYQQQWLDELCHSPHGLQLAPEVTFAGSPNDYAHYQELTGGRPAVLILTYSSLAQLGSPTGKGGFDAQSVEMFLQQADVQHVMLDEVHKVADTLDSVTTDVTRLFVKWQRDGSLRSLIGFSGTARAYRSHLGSLGFRLCYSVPIDALVAAGFVAPFAEMGVPAAYSARERRVRELLTAYKTHLQAYFDLLGPATLRNWFAEIDPTERTYLAHHVLGMYRGRSDWSDLLQQRFAEWIAGGEHALKLTEAPLVSIIQLVKGWSDHELAFQAGVPGQPFDDLVQTLDAIRSELQEVVYLPKTLERLQAEGFTQQIPAAALRALPQSDLPASAQPDATKALLATTITGLYSGLTDWYVRTGEGRVGTIKAVIEAEQATRLISGIIVFDRGRHMDWRHGVCVPGYDGVAGLFNELLGDERYTVMAALSNEMYFTYDPKDPVTLRIADYIHHHLMDGEVAQSIFNLLIAGLDLDEKTQQQLEDLFFARFKEFTAALEHMHAGRPGAFHHQVLRPVQHLVKRLALGAMGERLLGRMDKRNADLRRLHRTLFDYGLLAVHFREAHIAEAEQVSGARQPFQVVTMPSGARRKQLMYDLTARIVDAPEILVNVVIVSDWARTGWNVIRPNLLIDATATRNVTAWQQLRGRAIRAWPTWTNDCYRLLSMLIGHDLLTGEEEAPDNPNREGRIDSSLGKLLETITTPAQRAYIATRGIDALSTEERQALVVALLRKHNKVTHIYELVRATGSTSQVTYDRTAKVWLRREGVAAKHRHEVSVNPLTGRKSSGVDHAPLFYAQDPRTDVPEELQRHLATIIRNCDNVIVAGWLDQAEERQEIPAS